ncbi:MAG: peptidoglycan-binding protein [Gammaproteobacteria bacterium]|nr:peptidoglycan-binding protein [Gammaproteobacteria bacterium]
MKQLIYSLLLMGTVFTAHAKTSPYDAARHGNLDTLRKYRFEGIDLFVPDERGFIPYELAALHADPEKSKGLRKHVEIMLWLKEYQAKKHRYGKASTALVQAGLNALGYPVGRPDGIIGKKTSDAIRSFQKANELAQTGKLGPQWLGTFYQDILKDMQFKLTKLGFDTKGTDGLMGKNTRNAMLKFRTSKDLSNPEYPHLDALLISSINNAYSAAEKRKQAATQEKTRSAQKETARYIQAGLRTLGHRIGKIDGIFGSKTSNAIKKFQKRYKLSVTGEVNDKTQVKMDTIFLKETQRKLNKIGYKVGKPDGKIGKKTLAAFTKFRKRNKLSGNGFTANLIESIDDKYDGRIVSKPRKKTQRKPGRRKSSSYTPQTSVDTTNIISPKTTTQKTTAVKGNHAKGRMRFNRKNGRVIGCSIAGRGIPIEWCEPFYPLPKKNHCEATFKASSGVVLNLWCK